MIIDHEDSGWNVIFFSVKDSVRYSHTPIYRAIWGKEKMHGMSGKTVYRGTVIVRLMKNDEFRYNNLELSEQFIWSRPSWHVQANMVNLSEIRISQIHIDS